MPVFSLQFLAASPESSSFLTPFYSNNLSFVVGIFVNAEYFRLNLSPFVPSTPSSLSLSVQPIVCLIHLLSFPNPSSLSLSLSPIFCQLLLFLFSFHHPPGFLFFANPFSLSLSFDKFRHPTFFLLPTTSSSLFLSSLQSCDPTGSSLFPRSWPLLVFLSRCLSLRIPVLPLLSSLSFPSFLCQYLPMISLLSLSLLLPELDPQNLSFLSLSLSLPSPSFQSSLFPRSFPNALLLQVAVHFVSQNHLPPTTHQP
mmetsp:Transcript_35759/g.55867  ORF Transcript_35759/g.55867 Transcript_35759/m.55867 type:complete len:254 (-) Transcript_35759:50-811(-)